MIDLWGVQMFAMAENERAMVWGALEHWRTTADAPPLPVELLGVADRREFDVLVERLQDAVIQGAAQSEIDWARTFMLTEFACADDDELLAELHRRFFDQIRL